MTDSRDVAIELEQRLFREIKLFDGKDEVFWWDSRKCTALLMHALADAERLGLERAAKEVPTNWCDPLLTGPNGIAKAVTAFTCRSIEQLLRGIQDRIRAQAQADREVQP